MSISKKAVLLTAASVVLASAAFSQGSFASNISLNHDDTFSVTLVPPAGLGGVTPWAGAVNVDRGSLNEGNFEEQVAFMTWNVNPNVNFDSITLTLNATGLGDTVDLYLIDQARLGEVNKLNPDFNSTSLGNPANPENRNYTLGLLNDSYVSGNLGTEFIQGSNFLSQQTFPAGQAEQILSFTFNQSSSDWTNIKSELNGGKISFGLQEFTEGGNAAITPDLHGHNPPTPEPSSMVLGLMSIGSLFGFKRNKKA